MTDKKGEITMLFRILLPSLGAILSLLGFAWLGLKIRAPRLPALPADPAPPMRPLPDGLPAPVARYAAAVYGDALPKVESAVVQGRARLAPTGLPMPCRFRFYYDGPGANYYHDIRVTWWRRTVMRIHERLLDGHSILDLSLIGRVEDDPNTNRAAVQGYWAEVLAWIPALALADSRLRWQAVDDSTARVLLPGLDDVEAFTLRFDADSGLLQEIETLRYAEAGSDTRRRWRNRVLRWEMLDGVRVPVIAETQWDDEPPWATWQVEQVALNLNVSARLAQFGGDV